MLLILFDSLSVLNLPKSLFQNLTVPIQYGLYQSSRTLGKQFEFIVLMRKAALENNALKGQLSELLSENATLRRKLAETETLVDQYDKLNPQTFDQLPARPLGLGRFLIIDKGADDGVRVDQVVVYQDSYLGKVQQVSPKISEVLLIKDPSSKIAVFSQNSEGRAKGILSGQFGSQLLMDKILHQENIQVGDLVYSEGAEGKFPKGLIMGRVTEVIDRQNQVFKAAKVEPVFDAGSVNLVFVIRNP